jgi:hypothetical protein
MADEEVFCAIDEIGGHSVTRVSVPIIGEISVKCIEEISPIDAIIHSDYQDMTGHKVWESHSVLCKYFADNFNNGLALKALELGSGMGVPGIFLAKLGHNVTLSDNEPSVLKLLEENCVLNNSTCDVISIDWEGNTLKNGDYSIVFASDCCYDTSVLPYLFRTAFAALKQSPSSRFLLANVQNRLYCTTRSAADQYLGNIASSAGFTSMDVLEGHSDQSGVDISLLSFSPM